MLDKHDGSDAAPSLNRAELLFASVLIALGIFIAVVGSRYGVGSINRMGPGFFPTSLGVLMAVLGIILIFEQRFAPKVVLVVPWRAMLVVLAGLMFWAWAIRPLGLAPATFGLIMISSFADPPFRPVAALTMALVLSVGGVILFIHGFRLPMAAFNW